MTFFNYYHECNHPLSTKRQAANAAYFPLTRASNGLSNLPSISLIG